jgi:hypothetical protein
MDYTKKHTSRAFEKDVYFLGLKEGIPLWLEEPKWNCGWYWGCGYVETYTEPNKPSQSRDIDSHSHLDSMFKTSPFYDEKGCAEEIGFQAPHLTQKDRWKLADLFKTMYTLQEAAAVIGRGSSHITTVDSFGADKEMAKNINEVKLPEVFKAIRDILTP